MKLKKLQSQIAIRSVSFLLLFVMTIILMAMGEVVLSTISNILTLLSFSAISRAYQSLRRTVRYIPKWLLLPRLREERLFRPLANHLLRASGIPTRIPNGALSALSLCWHRTRSESPLDWPVIWDSPDDTYWYWLRSDLPVVAVQRTSKEWERHDLMVTY